MGQADLSGLANALIEKCGILCAYGALDEAEQAYQESQRNARNIGSRWLEANAILGLSQVTLGRRQWDTALVAARERLTIMEELGHQHGMDVSYAQVGTIYTHAQDYDKACEIIDLHLVMCTWAWSDQALIGVGRYSEAVETMPRVNRYGGALKTLPSMTAIIAEGGWRYYSVDNLIAWAMLLTSDCPLQRNGEPLLQADRVEMACEILTLVRDYSPDRSRAISRTRAAKLLTALKARIGHDGAIQPAPVAQRTAKEISRALLKISLETMLDTDDIPL